MPEGIALIIIVVAALVSGGLLVAQFSGRGELDGLARLVVSLGLGLILIGWFAFTLAELALFSLGALVALWASVVAFGLLRWRSRPPAVASAAPDVPDPDFFQWPGPSWLPNVLLLIWLPAATWLFFRPHEYIIGAGDAGVYVNTAAHIANSGKILERDETLAALDPALYPVYLRPRPQGEGTPYYLFPGFNVPAAPEGRVIPDFFHLHPSWQAVAYRLAGVRAALLLPGLWALLASVAIYLTLRDIAGWPAAMLALVGLSLSAIQVWFARYPVAESLTQFLVWTGLYAMANWLAGRRRQPLWGLLAGAALGQVLLVRVDMIFLAIVPATLAIWLSLRGRLRRRDLWFFVPFAAFAVHGLIHALTISGPYVARILRHAQRILQNNWVAGLFLLVFTGAMIVAFHFILRRGHAGQRVWARSRRFVTAAGVLAILLLAAYAWFLRPVIGATPSYQEWYDGQTIVLTDRENLRRLGWYLSPLGILLGVAGASLMLWRLQRRTVVLVGVSLFFSLLYLWRIQATPHQIYAMRRYMPIVAPFLIVAAAYCCAWLAAQKRRVAVRIAGAVLALAWLFGLAWSARGFVSQVDYHGFAGQVEDLASTLAPDSVVIFDYQTVISLGDILGTPLHYLHGHDVLVRRAPDAAPVSAQLAQLGDWLAGGRTVYWVGEPNFLEAEGIEYTSGEVAMTFDYLEYAYDHKPDQIIPVRWTLPWHRLNAVPPAP